MSLEVKNEFEVDLALFPPEHVEAKTPPVEHQHYESSENREYYVVVLIIWELREFHPFYYDNHHENKRSPDEKPKVK